MIVLAIPAAIYLPQIVGNSILFGTERHRDLLRVLLIEAVAKVSIGLFLVHKMGLLGLAFGTGIPQFIIYGFVFPVVMHRAVGVSVGRFYVTFLRSALIAAAVGAPISLLMRYVAPPIAWPQFVLNVLAVMLCALPAGYMLVEKDDRARIRGLLKRA